MIAIMESLKYRLNTPTRYCDNSAIAILKVHGGIYDTAHTSAINIAVIMALAAFYFCIAACTYCIVVSPRFLVYFKRNVNREPHRKCEKASNII
jgi:hypothetical protein